MLTDELKRARAAGVPLVAVSTPDQPAVASAIQTSLTDTALIEWDLVRGHKALNESGASALAIMLQGRDNDLGPLTNFTEVLSFAERLPQDAMLICHQAWLYLDDIGPRQGLLNLRDRFKSNGRTIVLLGLDFKLPPELAQDFLVLDDPYPTQEAIKANLRDVCTGNDISIDSDTEDRATAALRGLASFPGEQAIALSFIKRGGKATIDVARLWQRKRSTLESIKGLAMLTPRFSFDDVGGAAAWKSFAGEIQSGPEPWSCVVWLDEIEKALAGAGGSFGDSSGVSQDQLGTILTEMELADLTGATLLGPAGSGKSLLAEATAKTFDLPLFRMDLGAAKGMYVGQSEAAIRQMMKTIVAIGGKDALFVATANGIDNLPAALRRRLGVLGIWFVDLPDSSERESIARIQTNRYKIDDSTAVDYFRRAEGWSGANIRDCCRAAYKRACTVDKAARSIVAASVQEGDALGRLRTNAAGRYLSAAYDGVYHLPLGVDASPEMKIRKVGIIAEVSEEETKPTVDKSKLN